MPIFFGVGFPVWVPCPPSCFFCGVCCVPLCPVGWVGCVAPFVWSRFGSFGCLGCPAFGLAWLLFLSCVSVGGVLPCWGCACGCFFFVRPVCLLGVLAGWLFGCCSRSFRSWLWRWCRCWFGLGLSCSWGLGLCSFGFRFRSCGSVRWCFCSSCVLACCASCVWLVRSLGFGCLFGCRFRGGCVSCGRCWGSWRCCVWLLLRAVGFCAFGSCGCCGSCWVVRFLALPLVALPAFCWGCFGLGCCFFGAIQPEASSFM